MNCFTIIIFILLGLLILVIRHLVWRGTVSAARKTIIKMVRPKYKDWKEKKFTYGGVKYKNQQLIISIVGFFVFSLVLIVVFIWLPDMWFGYQIMLSMAAILVPGTLFGILISRRKD